MKTTKFVFWLMPFFVFSLVCSFATTGMAQSYYPSEVGNTWKLSSADGAEQRTYVLEKPEDSDDEGIIILKISTGLLGGDKDVIDKYFVSAHDGGLLLHQTATDEGAFGIAEATFDPPVIFFPALLPLGHTWEFVVETELKIAGAATSTTVVEVVAIEDVETPAGTFKDCVKLELRARSVTALVVVRTTSYQWLAPDVGPVKYQDDQDIVYELQSYKLVGAPSAEDVAADDAVADDTEVDATATDDSTEAEDAAADTTADDAAPEMPVSQMFEVTLTNLTTGEHGVSGQILSPPIFVTHPAGVNLAEVGQPASPALVALAENGDTSGLAAFATATGANVTLAEGVVDPGQAVTVTVTADMVNSSLSVGSMLVSTNDAFIAATDVALFDENGDPVEASLDLMAYDAGSEENTEMASDIPGPLGLDEATDPPMSNERVPTEGGVIAAHEGIQGGADVGEAFAWEEPTAMLTIMPVSAPAEPVVEEPMPEPVVEGPGFDVTLEPGLNMISIPLMPAEPYTAKSLAEMLDATAVIQLDAATQHFVAYTVVDEGDGFGITGDKGYIVNTPAGGMVKFTGDAWDNQPEQPEPEEAPAEEPAPEEVVEEPAAEEEAPAEEVAEEPAAEEEAPDAEGDDAAAAEEDDAEDDAADAGGDAAEEDDAADAGGDADAAAAAPALSTYKSAWAFIVTSDIHGMQTG
ncbi:hypothetical protein F4X10_16070, partial [Candidatus Poribacteria bacterium]|nr:hypothetical protein [Candidatus Poribacteria bacterium]